MHDEPFWTALGLVPLEIQVLAALAETATRGRQDLCVLLSAAEADVDGALRHLTDLRLIHASGQTWELLEPRVAVSALARRIQSELDHAPAVAQRMHERYAAARDESAHQMLKPRLLAAVDVTKLVIEALESATVSIDALVAPPVATDVLVSRVEADALRRGVRIRSVIDATVALDGQTQANLIMMRGLGEHLRVHPGLSTKLLIIDERTAIVPATGGSSSVHAIQDFFPASVALAQNYFDMVWAAAAEIREWTVESGEEKTAARRMLVSLLHAGLTDEAICRHLAISHRTLRRRITELCDTYSVRTRFQLGAAIERGR